LERRPAPGMELGTVSARELGCSGSRAGCSDAKPIARGTRATTEERNRFYAIDNCVCPLPVVAAVPAALMKRAAGNRRSLFAGGTPATTVSVLPTSYGDLFGEAVADAAAEVAAAAAGDGTLASPGFTLINSTSKMSIAFGPISPPVPPGP
jgi:hypothetical protein